MGVVSHPLRFRRPGPKRTSDSTAAQPSAVDGDSMMKALVLRQHQKAALGRVLLAEGLASEDQVLDTLAQQYRMQRAEITGHTPNARLLALKPAQFWLRHCALPWLQLGQAVTIAIAHPDRFEALKTELGDCLPQIIPVLVSEAQITRQLTTHFSSTLARQANLSVDESHSCRSMRLERGQVLLATSAPLAMLISWYAPSTVFTAFTALALLSVLMFSVLKICGLATYLSNRQRPERSAPSPDGATTERPVISIMVPLYKEAEISRALLSRIRKLDYPRALTDVVLVLEAHDDITRRALSNTHLPPWIRIIEVPAFGGLTTKPRAMNYALNFCRGTIIGVWDAEDAPQVDQLERVAQAFSQADKKTACFQGILDFYNPGVNWISRCFTLEYGGWFRVVLAGIAKLGLVVPLGGTTMFIRRNVLEKLGGWDAHNVTEDADLGVRLYRAGYRTEMLPSTTFEEANYRSWPWVKQRSRWLKGFMVTYLVHMRQPLHLRSELGWKRFLGFQAFFLGTIGQFLFAPLLWSFWLITLGLPHPSAEIVPAALLTLAAASLVFFELLGMCVAVTAAFAMGRPWLACWAPALLFYFPMGAIAVAKAAHELLTRPYFWDKTAHGVKTPPRGTASRGRRWFSRARSHPVSSGS